MAELIITHRQKDYLPKMPYQVIISGRLVGVMRTPQARLQEHVLNRQRRLYKMQQWKEKHLKRKK